jgi:FtsP/CotA-like multicopper oxidase with cupredoxin domain
MLGLTTASAAVGAFGLPTVYSPARAALAKALSVSSRVLEVNGKAASVYGLTRSDGVWGLYEELGGRFRVSLTNELDTETLIHWHGLTPPSAQDGVPELSQPALPPGQTYAYDFLHERAGTFWMHSHVGLQEQKQLAAPLIVRDPAEAGRDEQEVVILLHDFAFREPEEIFMELRHGGQMTMGSAGHDQPSDAPAMDMGAAEPSTEMGHGAEESMDMGHGAQQSMVHFNDIEYDAYLANDRTLADPEVVRVEPGGRVRLRIINGAAGTNFLLDLGALQGELIAVDGNPVVPIAGRQFDLAIAQRLDIRLALPAGQGAYPVLARREADTAQTGVVLATKAATVSRIAERAHHKARPLDLDLEARLVPRAPLAARPADRTHVLALTGSHNAYDWGINEMGFDPDNPLFVAEGERVEIVLPNKTAMPHPIHLHGHHFQVVAFDGKRVAGAVRDTVLVPPERSVTIAFDADNPGHWAFHCHQLYHMAAGMFTSIRYEGYDGPGG